jgi:hexosaminidase
VQHPVSRATLLHALKIEGANVSLPKMEVKDWPHADFTGIMIDCARQDIPIIALKDAVMAARFFKVRYRHLHFSEDSAFVFPLKCYKAGRSNGAISNGDTLRVWDLEEPKKLVAFADARGVTLVPKLELPGHSGAMQRDCPEIAAGRLIDMAKDRIYPILNQVISEICDVFQSSPCFHIGGDEIEFAWYGLPHVKAYMKEHDLGTDIHTPGLWRG